MFHSRREHECEMEMIKILTLFFTFTVLAGFEMQSQIIFFFLSKSRMLLPALLPKKWYDLSCKKLDMAARSCSPLDL